MVAQRAAELVIDEPSTQKTTSTEPSQVSRLINSSPNHRVTPSPREASTFTPGSASQALIRKAIADELGGDRIKRPRVNFDGRLSPSALGDARKAETLPNLLVDLTQETSHSYEQLSTVAETTTSQPIDNDSARTGEDVLSDYSDNEIETYYDPAEGVSRCQICGSEVYIISVCRDASRYFLLPCDSASKMKLNFGRMSVRMISIAHIAPAAIGVSYHFTKSWNHRKLSQGWRPEKSMIRKNLTATTCGRSWTSTLTMLLLHMILKIRMGSNRHLMTRTPSLTILFGLVLQKLMTHLPATMKMDTKKGKHLTSCM